MSLPAGLRRADDDSVPFSDEVLRLCQAYGVPCDRCDVIIQTAYRPGDVDVSLEFYDEGFSFQVSFRYDGPVDARHAANALVLEYAIRRASR